VTYLILDKTRDSRKIRWSCYSGISVDALIDERQLRLFSQVIENDGQIDLNNVNGDSIIVINAAATQSTAERRISGIDVAQRLREEPDKAPYPIILVSHEPRWIAEEFDRYYDPRTDPDDKPSGRLAQLLEPGWHTVWLRLPFAPVQLHSVAAELRKKFEAHRNQPV
jgi:hypothetical protein